MAKKARKTKTIRTLPDLRQALDSLVIGGCDAHAIKHTVERCTSRTRSTSTFFAGEIFIKDPPDGGPAISISEIGDTPLDAFIACRARLQQEIEERARKRKLNHREQKVIEHKPKRIGHTELVES